jgi:hypothetical protein
MSEIKPASFRSSEKRKAKARRAKIAFDLTSSVSPFSPSFYHTNSIPSTVVKRYLLKSNDRRSPSSRQAYKSKADDTPLFSCATKHDAAAADRGTPSSLSRLHNPFKGDSSLTSPLRQINGEGKTWGGFNEALRPSVASPSVKKILSSFLGSTQSSADDGTVHDDWVIEDQQVDAKEGSGLLEVKISNKINAFEVSNTDNNKEEGLSTPYALVRVGEM